MQILEINKKRIITIVFIIASLLGYMFFPAEGIFQTKIVAITFLAVLPFFYAKFALKENILLKIKPNSSFKKSSYFTIACVLAALLLTGIVFRYTNLLDHYPLPRAVRNDFWKFISYEFISISFTLFLYEFFFRGFVMFYFKGFMNKWAIAVQAILFCLMLWALAVPFAFSFWYIIFIPFTGLIAYESESLLYSFFGQLLYIIIVDACALALIAK